MTMRKPMQAADSLGRKAGLAALAALACFGQAAARPLITINDVPDSPALIAHFAKADADTGHDYKLILRWRKDASGNTVKWAPLSTITLKKGHVYVLGSQSDSYPERYVFDGQGARNLFVVDAAAGHKPTLTLSGITVQNGWGKFGSAYPYGGGLYAKGADDIQIYFCKFLNNKSNQNGSGIATNNTRNIYIKHTLVDGNRSDQTHETDQAGCGGITSGGGGIAILNSAGSTSASIHYSTLSNNLACRGGGLELWGNVNLYMYQNTISGNIGVGRAAGIFWHGGSGSATLRFNTIAYNRAATSLNLPAREPRYGGGIGFWGFSGSIYTDGNIIAKNQVVYPPIPALPYVGHDCYSDASNVWGSPHTNFVGIVDNCGVLGSAGSWGIGTSASPRDPKLNDLLERGTAVSFQLPVHYPYQDSPVRGNFFNLNYNRCDHDDQRGLIRSTYYNNCDIGSVEYGAALP